MVRDPFNEITDLSDTFDRKCDHPWKNEQHMGDNPFLRGALPVLEKEDTDIHRAQSGAEDSIQIVILHKHKPP